MFPSSINFRYFSPINLVERVVSPCVCQTGNPVFSWIAFGKIAENPIVTPGTTTQVVRPSAVNRYLQTVTVKATTTTTP